jgi:hypothetical protein
MTTEHDVSGRTIDQGPATKAAIAVLDRPAPAAPPAPPRRPLTRLTRIAVPFIVVLALLETVGLGTRYLLTDHRWVITDNAKIDGDQIEIIAPVTGVLSRWRIDLGSSLDRNEVVGRVRIENTGAQVNKVIRSPNRGTVAFVGAAEGQYVTQGALLATAYGDQGIYVTARVPDSEIGDVRLGAPADILVDAYPGARVRGTVSAISPATAGVDELTQDPNGDPLDLASSPYPGSDTDPQNPQRVDQYIPVKIQLTDTGDVALMPGMNATVHIHRS